MSYIKINILLLLSIVHIAVFGQDRSYRLFGQVLDKELLEPVVNVHVLVVGTNIGTITDAEGKFEIDLIDREGVRLRFFHTAFEMLEMGLDAADRDLIKVFLQEKQYQTQEIVIRATNESLVRGTVPGKMVLKQKEILITPALLGEPDIVRSLQLLPGIQSVNEGNSGIYVRGGSPGQNYILFDGIELMNPSHLMGIYSVFNPYLVDNVAFYKGNAPVDYNNRLASSIVVNSIDNKKGDYNWVANIGNLTSNICYQGKTRNNKWFFHTGFRRSYLEGIRFVAEQFIEDEENYFTSNKFNFYDFNGKLKYQGKQSSVTLAWYSGGDVFEFAQNRNKIALDNKWGNQGAVVLFKHLFGSRFSMNSSLAYSGYKSDLNLGILEQKLSFNNRYSHVKAQTSFVYDADKHVVRFGLAAQCRQIMPHSLDLSLGSGVDDARIEYQHRIFEFYAGDEYRVLPRLDVYFGGGLQLYQHADKMTNGFSDDKAYSQALDKARFMFKGIVNFTYLLTSHSSIKGSVGYVPQNIHLTSIASIPLPSDVWMPATGKVPEENGKQLTLGYFKEIDKWDVEMGIEGYSRWQENQLMLNVNFQGDEIVDFEDNFFKGESKAYGIEVYAKKSYGKFNSNISYTLGWVQQRFDELNDEKWHDAKYDRRHDLNVLCSYRINDRIDLGGVFVYASGNKTTLPVGRYWMMGDIANDYEGINNYRMPGYQRFDLSVNYKLKSDVFKESVLNFSVINVFNRSNPYFIYYDVLAGEGSYELDISARQVSLFPILPSISWKFKF